MDVVRRALGAAVDADAGFERTPARTFVRMLRDVALAVHCAHEEGLLHLDIKPSNVLVRSDGTPLLADFGVVREMDLRLTRTQSFAGTPVYAAPEQLRRDDAAFGPATDVYGLGMTLYELLARTQPLPDVGLTEMLRRVETGRIPRLSTRVQVASDLENIVHKAIATEPRDRYASAVALAADLTAFLEGLPVVAHPERRIRRIRRWARAEPWKAAVVAVLAVTLPIVLGLGVTLLLVMPHVDAARERENRQQARLHVQAALLTRLVSQRQTAASLGDMRAAQLLAPHANSVFVCVIAHLDETGLDAAGAAIEALPAAQRACDGVQLLQRRLREKRPFLHPDEVAKLARSSEPLDLMLLVVDRILLHADTDVERHLEVARQALQDLRAVQQELDPLTVGLLCWVAGALRDEDLLRSSALSIRTLWPDVMHAQAWRIYGQGLVDPERGVDAGREVLSDPPDHVIALAMASQLIKTGNVDAAIAMLQASEFPAARLAHQHDVITYLHALAGRHDQARTMLADPRHAARNPLDIKLDTLRIVDPDAAHRTYLDLIQRRIATVAHLGDAIELAIERRDFELLTSACVYGRDAFPHRARLRHANGDRLMLMKDYVGAASEYRGIELPRQDFAGDARGLAVAFCRARDWDALLALCERWQREHGDDPVRMHYYLGIAQARSGDPNRAMLNFQRHLSLGEPQGLHRVEAFFESMWLQVAPDGPPELRAPAAARATLARCRPFLQRARQDGRPWLLAVGAEVCFANGEIDEAIRYAEAAQACVDGHREADPADLGALIDAALTRYRRQ